jgi:hypothetical protein
MSGLPVEDAVAKAHQVLRCQIVELSLRVNTHLPSPHSIRSIIIGGEGALVNPSRCPARAASMQITVHPACAPGHAWSNAMGPFNGPDLWGHPSGERRMGRRGACLDVRE